MIVLIKTPKDFKKHYYYKSPPNPEPCPALDKYPKKYPCILHRYEVEVFMGSVVEHELIYIPKGLDVKSFFEGYKSMHKNDAEY
jgi:hypothetical protein